MARTARVAPGGLVYHVLNRGVARLPLFRKEADYAAFERVLLSEWPVNRPKNWTAVIYNPVSTKNTSRYERKRVN